MVLLVLSTGTTNSLEVLFIYSIASLTKHDLYDVMAQAYQTHRTITGRKRRQIMRQNFKNPSRNDGY